MDHVFDHKDYKKYVQDVIRSRPKNGHGFRLELAEAMQCQPAYVSQVLHGESHFSLEQGDRLCRFLKLSSDEKHFFMLLLQQARAASASLREYFQGQIQEILERRLVLKDRLKMKSELSGDHQAIYYGSWHYAAIHILLTIPEYRTARAIADYLRLPRQRVQAALDFLVSVGLASEEGSKYGVGKTHIHVGNDSEMLAKHHANWRTRALQSLDREVGGDLHYSSVVSLSKADVLEIKSQLIKNIEAFRAKVKPSKEETLYAFCLDFFDVAD